MQFQQHRCASCHSSVIPHVSHSQSVTCCVAFVCWYAGSSLLATSTAVLGLAFLVLVTNLTRFAWWSLSQSRNNSHTHDNTAAAAFNGMGTSGLGSDERSRDGVSAGDASPLAGQSGGVKTRRMSLYGLSAGVRNSISGFHVGGSVGANGEPSASMQRAMDEVSVGTSEGA